MTPELAKDSLESMARSVTAQLNNCARISPAEATSVNEAIIASVFTAEIKTALANVVLNKLSDVRTGTVTCHGKQTMNHPYNYLTNSDWEYLKDERKSNVQVAQRVRDRMVLVGLHKPTEPTFGKLACAIAAARAPDMEPASLHALVLDLKQINFGSSGQPVGPSEYPRWATDLQAGVIAVAYADEGPAPMALEHFNALVGRCPLRASHKTVRPAPAKALVQVVGRAAPQVGGIDASMVQQMFTSFMQMCANQNQSTQRLVITQPHDGDAAVDADTALSAPSHLVAHQINRTSSGSSSLNPNSPATRQPLSLADLPARRPSDASDQTSALCFGTRCHYEEEITIGGEETPVEPVPSAVDVLASIEEAAGCGKALGASKKRPAGAPAKKPACAAATPALAKKPACAAATPVKKTAAGKASASKRKLSLGCSRCRGSKVGCLSCRSPAFKGMRFTK